MKYCVGIKGGPDTYILQRVIPRVGKREEVCLYLEPFL